MTTMAQQEDHLRELHDDESVATRLTYTPSGLMILVLDRDWNIEIYSSAHWGSMGNVELARRAKEGEPRKTRRVNCASGGQCEDATIKDVTEAMIGIWQAISNEVERLGTA